MTIHTTPKSPSTRMPMQQGGCDSRMFLSQDISEYRGLITAQFHGKSNREFRELQHMSKAKLIGDINATKQIQGSQI